MNIDEGEFDTCIKVLYYTPETYTNYMLIKFNKAGIKLVFLKLTIESIFTEEPFVISNN